MSERGAMLKDRWLACAIYWAAMVVVAVVSMSVNGSLTGRNPFDGFIYLSFVYIPVFVALVYAMELREARQRASLPRSFRAKRYRVQGRGIGFWVFVIGAVAWSIGGMLWVPDSAFITLGVVMLMFQLSLKMGEAIFLSTRDDP
jgi:predicted membrane channel-forming protein YqfA (hemolysin III family)